MSVIVRGAVNAGANSTTTASTRAPGVPAGTQTGDLLLLSACWSGGSTVTVTTPAGWSVGVAQITQTNDNFAVFWRTSDGTGNDTPTLTISSAVDYIATCTALGAWTGTPVFTSVLGGAASTTATWPAITPNTAADLLLYISGLRVVAVSTQVTAVAPAGGTGGTVTSLIDGCTNVTGTSNCEQAVFTQQLTAATAISQETSTVSTSVSSANCAVIVSPSVPPAKVGVQFPPAFYIKPAVTGMRKRSKPSQPALIVQPPAFIVVQVSPTVNVSSGTLTATLPQPTGSGNTLVACITGAGSTGVRVPTGLTLGGSADHWQAAYSDPTTTGFACYVWYDPNCAAGQTSVVLSATAGSGTGLDSYLTVYEVTGILTFDQGMNGDATAASATWSSNATATTATANEIFFGVTTASNQVPIVTGVGPWITQSSGAGTFDQVSGYQIVTSIGTATFSGTLTGSNVGYAAVAATFRVLTSQQFSETLTAIIAAIDVNRNQIGKTQNTPVAVSGGTRNFISKTVSTLTATTGTVTRMVLHVLATVVAVVTGTFTATRTRIAVLVTSLAAQISTQRLIGHINAAKAAVTGTLPKALTRVFTSVLAVTPVVIRKILKLIIYWIYYGLSGFPAVPGIAVPGVTDPGQPQTTVGGLGVSAALSLKTSKSFQTVAAVTAGNVVRKVFRIFTASTAVTASMSRLISKNLTVVIAAISILRNQVNRQFNVYAAVPATIVTTKVKQMVLSAVAALGGTLTRRTGKPLTAQIVVTPAVTRILNRVLAATIAVTVTVTAIKAKFLTLIANVAAVNTITRSTGKPLSSEIIVESSPTTNRISSHFPVPVAVTVTTVKGLAKTFIAPIAVMINQTQIKLRTVILSAAAAVTGSIQRKITPNLPVSVIIVSRNIRGIARTIQGNLISAGQTVRGITRVFTAPVSVTFVLTQTKFKSVILAVSIAVSNVVQRNVSKVLPTQIVVTAATVKRLFKKLTAPVVTFSGFVIGSGHVYLVALTTGFAVVSSVSLSFIMNVKDLVFKQGVIAFRWIIGSATKRWKV